MIKTVIDTNVFISSFFGGKPKQIIDCWKRGDITWCLSQNILDEYVAVLQRLGLNDKTELTELFKLFSYNHHAVFSMHPKPVKVVEKDPDDDKFFACALALDASYIISGDKEVLKINHYMGIKILSPANFLLEI